MPDMTRCWCESSHCDHTVGEPTAGFPHGVVGRCDRPSDPRFIVDYVGAMCTPCVSNMCASGGSKYITLAA